jgi:hypothetical protein
VQQTYLIEVRPGKFLVGDRGETVTATEVLSLACHFGDYRMADFAARSLHSRGYLGVVTDIYGCPVTRESFEVQTA